MTAPMTPHAEDDFGNGILAYDLDNMIALIAGPGLPTDATAGYATGCLFIHNDGGDGTAAYVNEGSSTSCDFNALDANSLAFLPLAGGTMTDGANVTVGSTTGTKIGTATTQKIGLWNVTPVVQPASANQAAVGAVTTVGANTGTAGAGLSLIGDTTAVNQATNLMNDLKALQEDISALQVLVNQLRSDLIAVGVIKGSA